MKITNLRKMKFYEYTKEFVLRKFVTNSYFGGINRAIGVCCLLLLPTAAFSQNIGINTTGNAPNASAALDIDIVQKGLLIPRLSTTDRNAIASPANSLLIFNITTIRMYSYSPIGQLWYVDYISPCQ